MQKEKSKVHRYKNFSEVIESLFLRLNEGDITVVKCFQEIISAATNSKAQPSAEEILKLGQNIVGIIGKTQEIDSDNARYIGVNIFYKFYCTKRSFSLTKIPGLPRCVHLASCNSTIPLLLSHPALL